jgi:amino acid adenylation domain-containing protein
VIRSPLDVAVLRRALEALVRRHAILRIAVSDDGESPVQRVVDAGLGVLDEVDASAWTDDDFRARLSESYLRPFDLEKGPVLRASLYRRGPAEHVVLLAVHHIATDAWSIGLMTSEWLTLYEALREGRPEPLAPLPARYADFVRWQDQMVAGAAGEEMLAYWRQQLRGPLPTLQLPTDRSRPAVPSFRGSERALWLEADVTLGLRALAQQHRTTLFTVLLAAYQVLLHRYSGQDDLLIGTPTAGRSRSEFEGIVGYFVNPVVMRGDLSGDPTFADLLRRTGAMVVDALRNADYPFPLLVQHLNPVREANRSPLFQAEFNLVRITQLGRGGDVARPAAVSTVVLGGLVVETMGLPQQAGQFDLSLDILDLDGPLMATLKYSTDLFEASTIERMAGHLETLLRGIVAKPTARISALPLLTRGEREAFSGWNATGADLPEACVHELIAERAAAVPERVAVESGEGCLTFGELEARAERLGGVLRERGVGPGVLVGVYMERGLAMLAALLGVWKAGGAYVPLDPGFPAERLSYMVEDSGAALLLTQSGLSASLPTRAVPAIVVDEPAEEPGPGVARASGVRGAVPEDLAYVIYTSGSTGRPKGVAITHRALVNLLLSMGREPGLGEGDVLLSVTTLSFDIAALELYLPLLVGARVYVASREDALDGRRLIELLDQSRATVMQATPATWRMLIEAGWEGTPGLRVLCGGEALPRDLAEAMLARAGEVWNVYGPTETTVWSSVERVGSGEGPVSIGRPIANTQMWVLDGRLKPLPVGVSGELYIGGTGVARGYWGRAELTAEKFVPDAFAGQPGSRLYRTGDLARWLPDGRLECLGRIDHQVKVRGFRIELGEIEAALREQPRVRNAVVTVREDEPGSRRLVAYVVPEGDATGLEGELRPRLRTTLPEHMVPSTIVLLDSLPLTPNGKVDRKALPAPERQARASIREYVGPANAMEARISQLWAAVLGEPTVGVEDNFFDLGGTSFLLTRVVSRARKDGLEITPLDVFRFPTVRALASRLVDGGAGSPDYERVRDRARRQREAMARAPRTPRRG